MANIEQSSKPTLGEQSSRQQFMGFEYGPTVNGEYTSLFETWGSPYHYAAGDWRNPMGFPHWYSGYWGTYTTYRFMLEHYKVANVRSKVLNTILDASWELRYDPSVPQKWVKAVQELLALRFQYINDAYRSVDFGWAGFENIWKIEDGRYKIDRLKPLIHDFTRIIADSAGNFLGLTQGYLKNAKVLGKDLEGGETPGLDVYKSHVVTNDRYGTQHYGRSRLENIRMTAWIPWLDIAQQLMKLGVKITGFQPVIKVPDAEFVDEKGSKKSYRQDAREAIKNLVNGQGIVINNLALRKQPGVPTNANTDVELLIKLAQTSLIDVSVLDFGSQTSAITGLLQRLQHAEDSMVEGYLHSPREVAEAKHSSKGDTESHLEAGELDPMMVAANIDKYFQEGVVNKLLTVNFGSKAENAVRIYTPAIKSAKVQRAQIVINTMVQSNHVLGEKICDALGDDGMAQLFADANLKTSKKWSETTSTTEQQMQQQQDTKDNSDSTNDANDDNKGETQGNQQ